MTIRDAVVVVGTRPQTIKSYPLVKALRRHGFGVDVINTGQHSDYLMSGLFFRNLAAARPARNLGVGPGTPGEQLSRAIPKLEAAFRRAGPDLVIAPGDTTSALATAVAASKCGILLAHLEAGGRGVHAGMQEEINRRMIDHSSDILFAPTRGWADNLEAERVPGDAYFAGDTMYDLFLEERGAAPGPAGAPPVPGRVLVTIHRAEKIEERGRLAGVCGFLDSLCAAGLDLVFPVHPHTRKMLAEFGLRPDARMVDPVDHATMMGLVEQSSLVVTDSGGLQKEAYWMSRPCIAVHETFEWKELVDERANFPMWPGRPMPASRAKRIARASFEPKPSIFGSGNASERICEILGEY